MAAEVNSEGWRYGYRDARRTFLSGNNEERMRRLRRLNFLDLPREAKILDLGCGDGNVISALRQLGFSNVVGLEPDSSLVAESPERNAIVVGGGPDLPFPDAEFDAVLCMASLHHLKNTADMLAIQDELFRVLTPGGYLYYVEPADSMLRKILTPLLLSPLSELTKFSRQKKAMVLAEWPELTQWLRTESAYPQELVNRSFELQMNKVVGLKRFVRARKPVNDAREPRMEVAG